MDTNEKAYWNKDVARILGIGESTVRKWCLELEKNGYTFIRGHKDSRAFLQHDLNALSYFKDLTKVGSYTLEQAAEHVVARFNDRRDSDITGSVPDDNKRSVSSMEDDLKRLVELTEEQTKFLKEQVEINKILLKKILERDQFIENQTDRMNEEVAAIEHIETQHVNDIEEEKKSKKKRPIERIKSFFKK